MIGGIGMQELLIILLLVVVIFGAKRLPEIGNGLGKAIRNFKRAAEPEEIDITQKTKSETQKVSTDSAENIKMTSAETTAATSTTTTTTAANGTEKKNTVE